MVMIDFESGRESQERVLLLAVGPGAESLAAGATGRLRKGLEGPARS
jgi:hypothetical protein